MKTAMLQNVRIPMRDGVRLATDIFFPSDDGVNPAPGRFPVMLMRTAYGKEVIRSWPLPIPSAAVGWITPEVANEHGYVVVYQDARGTFDSEGVLEPMLNEGPDGFDTVVWLGQQPWSDGRIGTFGPSYMGGTQMLLAGEQPPGLVAAFSQVAATDQFKNDWVYLDGVLTGTAAVWTGGELMDDASTASSRTPAQHEALLADFAALGVADPKEMTRETFFGVFDKVWRSLPLIDLSIVRHAPWWRKWLENWDNPQHFENNAMSSRFEKIDVPILHIGGWFDLLLRNTYGHYKEITAQAKDPAVREAQRLLIGPWSHGICEFPPNAAVDGVAMQVAWMDQWLKGKSAGLFEHPVVLYIMGENRWRAESTWPLTGTQRTRFYLHSEGGANTAEGDGTLSTTPPNEERPDRFVYDPRDPTPTPGGIGLMSNPAALVETGTRPDVLVYSTPPLGEDLEVTGEIAATLYAASSATDTDWWMKLIDVAPNGEARILSQGVVRARYRTSRTAPSPLTPGKIEKYDLDMWATSNVFKKGHQIRVEVASSNFPYADRNPNAFIDLKRATEKDFVTASQTVHHDEQFPSYVELPIIPESRARNWIDTPFPLASEPETKQ